MRQKVHLQPGSHDRETVVTIRLLDGRELAERVETRRGAPQPEDVQRKALELMGPIAGDRAAKELIEQLMRAEQLQDVRDLRPALHAFVSS